MVSSSKSSADTGSRWSWEPNKMSSRSCLFSIIGIVALVVACGSPNSSFDQILAGEELETEAQAIDKMLICPVCPGSTIDQAHVPLAKQMRRLVRERLAEGQTRSEILDYFSSRERYGLGVLASPPKEGFNLLAWIIPLVVLAGGILVLAKVVKSMTSRTISSNDKEFVGLEAYLGLVDQDLASHRGLQRSDTGNLQEDRGSTTHDDTWTDTHG